MPKSFVAGLFAVLLSTASGLGCAKSADEPYDDTPATPAAAEVDAAPTSYPTFDASKPVDAGHDSAAPPHDASAPPDTGTPPPEDAAPPPPPDSGPPNTNMAPCIPTDIGQAAAYGIEAAASNQDCPCGAAQCCFFGPNKCVQPL